MGACDGHKSIVNPELNPNSKQRSHQMTEAPLHEVIHGSPIGRHFPFEPIEHDPNL